VYLVTLYIEDIFPTVRSRFPSYTPCNCKDIRFKSVRWHDDGSSEPTLGYATLLPVYILKTHHHAV